MPRFITDASRPSTSELNKILVDVLLESLDELLDDPTTYRTKNERGLQNRLNDLYKAFTWLGVDWNKVLGDRASNYQIERINEFLRYEQEE